MENKRSIKFSPKIKTEYVFFVFHLLFVVISTFSVELKSKNNDSIISFTFFKLHVNSISTSIFLVFCFFSGSTKMAKKTIKDKK